MRLIMLTVLIMTAVPALAQETDALLAEFLQAEGEEIESCFVDMPEMRDDQRDGDFRGATEAGPPPLRRLVVAFDASGSMAGTLGGTTKMDAAKQAVGAMLDDLPDDVTASLIAFGHQGTNDEAGRSASCAGVETLVSDTGERADLQSAISTLNPAGWTPLADALAQAGSQLARSEMPGEQVVYVVSDGEETCGGDPVAQARALHEGDIRAVVNILGLDLPAEERAQLEAVAKAGGGLFTPIASQNELTRVIDEMRRRNANSIEMLKSDNQSAMTQLRNSNASASALLKLDNCVSIRALRESNRLSKWMREKDLTPDQDSDLRAALSDAHADYSARAGDIRASLETERDDANKRVQDQRDQDAAEFEAAK
ncbi:VWA domain-containing protein [Paracoccus sp. TK19116]|uniref:VWA domain-containing protein n=1 Tax=Paracoccus albicereus TaxID=2922394 RepID=A0ABT1MN61_9RHOB|nr:VWA domain-containing protein [Paracoccus albicereus]MCQ0969720.1 VWA domain-containing protein [Paracoccus albicereus]